MTGEKGHLINLKPINGPKVIFRGNERHDQTKGIRKMHIYGLMIKDVDYVEGIKFYLLNTSQFCDKGYLVEFTKEECCVRDEITKKVVLLGLRKKNMYMVDWSMAKTNVCQAAKRKLKSLLGMAQTNTMHDLYWHYMI